MAKGMNLIEAVKSGKPFRRKGWTYNPTRWVTNRHKTKKEQLTTFDILADDWETKPEPREVDMCANCFDDGASLDWVEDICAELDHTKIKMREVPR